MQDIGEISNSRSTSSPIYGSPHAVTKKLLI